MADGSPHPNSTPANPRSAPEEVWARVREDYLAGVPAAEACRRHGVGLTAMRNRAAREGWRRADQPWTPPNRLDPEDEGRWLEESVDGDLDRIELSQLAFVASCRMMRAVMRGHAAEALRWRRVRLMLLEEEAELERLMAQDEAVWRMIRGARRADSVDSVD
jgi:hypothetical protein